MIFINIIETNGDKDCPRKSTLLAYPGKCLDILGNLPHGYEFKPATAADRDSLIEWLNTLEYAA